MGLGQLPADSAQDVGLALLRFPLTSSQPITGALLPLLREDSARQTSYDKSIYPPLIELEKHKHLLPDYIPNIKAGVMTPNPTFRNP